MAKETTVIQPSSGWKLINFREIYAAKDLVYFLVIRGIKAKYAQSILGVLWAVVQPLVQTLVFTVIFGNLAQLDSDGSPYFLFAFVAQVPWTYFSNVLSNATNSLVTNKAMLSKVYFPRLVLPISVVFAQLLDFAVGFVVMVGLLIYYGYYPGWDIFLVLPLWLIMVMASLGLGNLLAALSIRYRDVVYVIALITGLLMYSAPAVYSIEIIPEKYYFLYTCNPMVGVVEGMRSIFLGTKSFPWDMVLRGSIVAFIMFMLGTLYFRKVEKNIADIA
ncbi:MAG: ABC transporter permease [Pricia sp.]